MPSRWPLRASSCATSFVMSITVSDGSAQAIENGISTDVTIRLSGEIASVGLPSRSTSREVHPNWTRGLSLRYYFARQPEVDVLARNLDLRQLVVPGSRELGYDSLDELLRGRSARGEPYSVVAVEPLGAQLPLPVDQCRRRPLQAGDLDEALRVRARVRPD